MSFSAETKLYCNFDDLLFNNEVDGSSFSENGSHSLASGARDQGLQLNADSYLSTSSSLSITNQFSIGFWLDSTNVGLANSGSVLESIKLSLLSKSDFIYASNYVSLSDAQFLVYETTYDDGEHDISVYVKGATEATVTSEKYSVDEPHFFWISYNGSSSTIKIWVDGEENSTSTAGTIPASLNSSSADFQINRWVDGEDYKIARNTGVLDELVVLNVAVTDPVLIGRVINLGVEYAFDSDYTAIEEVYVGEIFNDPSTVRVNTVTSDTSEILIGRSDGKLLSGKRLIWENRRYFSSALEKSYISKKHGAESSDTYEIDNGIITVKSISIRV